MKDFNIFRVHEKPIYRWGLPKKGEGGRVWTVCRGQGGGLGKKKEVVFLRGVDTPMHNMMSILVKIQKLEEPKKIVTNRFMLNYIFPFKKPTNGATM